MLSQHAVCPISSSLTGETNLFTNFTGNKKALKNGCRFNHIVPFFPLGKWLWQKSDESVPVKQNNTFSRRQAFFDCTYKKFYEDSSLCIIAHTATQHKIKTESPEASCTKTCVDFLLKHGVRLNPENVVRIKISRCMNLCVHMNPSTFPLYIPINAELSAHVGVPGPSLSTPLFKYANHI